MWAGEAVARLMARWELTEDGPVLRTHASTLVPVRRGGMAAMLKLAHSLEEARGGRLMAWWARPKDEGGAALPMVASVLARHGPALLLARASGGSLAALEDGAATRAIVDVAVRLRMGGVGPPPRLVPLRRWFRALGPAAAHGGVLADCAEVAEALLAEPRDEGVLHGDLHHGNVLDFGAAGWLAIDPKGLWGEWGFEFAALFRNPDAGRALAPGRLARQAWLVAGLSGVDEDRLLAWAAAVAGLSAAWRLSEPGGDPGDLEADLALARLALEERARALRGRRRDPRR